MGSKGFTFEHILLSIQTSEPRELGVIKGDPIENPRTSQIKPTTHEVRTE